MSEGSPGRRQLILASRSEIRRLMLENAGHICETAAADVDEDDIRKRINQAAPLTPPREVAIALATAKAEDVSRKFPDALVIGADQVLELDGEIFTKAADLREGKQTLARLSGRTHILHSAVALAVGGQTVWHHAGSARMAMREMDEKTIEAYASRRPAVLQRSVGCYEIEDIGINLFEQMDGDYFTILGMPLLPLIGELRRRGRSAF